MLVTPLDLDTLAWPTARLDEALEIAAQQTGLVPRGLPSLPDSHFSYPASGADEADLEHWVEAIAARLGIEAEPMVSSFSEVAQMVRSAAPAILRLPREADNAPAQFLVLLASGRRPALLSLDLKVRRVHPQALRDALCLPLIAPWLETTDRLLTGLGGQTLSGDRLARARQALLEEQFSTTHVSGGWLLRVSPGADLWQQARLARLARPLLALLIAYLLQEGLLIVSWWIIGRGAFAGQFETVWLLIWALILFTAIPCQLLVRRSQGQLSVVAGALFKQRILLGALKMQPDEMRRQGLGQFLGRMMELETVELLALSGGLGAIISLAQLGIAVWVLTLGAGAALQVATLIVWIAATLLTTWLAYRRGLDWMDTYRGLTNDLVERMVGHRTRLAQEDPQRWHAGEDQMLARYLSRSQNFDLNELYLSALPATWLIVGLASMLPALWAAPNDPAKLAISLGGVLLAYQAFTAIQLGAQSLIQMGLSWQQVKPLFQAAARPGESAIVTLQPVTHADDPVSAESATPDRTARPPAGQEATGDRKPLLVARNLSFRYRERGPLTLHDCSLQIHPGDRLLLEGPSGGGKTTLAAILAGLRQPESGALLLHGYDRHSLGSEAWRRRVVIAPQFHENYIFSETFAFNLLMGRRWPPTPADFLAAEAICDELGLSDLLARMPSGWQQLVGENGWQLSHGERSRVFIARALLQHADLMIMDESFGALDPENLYRALACARKRAATLLVIAHP